jgi:hypothetical protein
VALFAVTHTPAIAHTGAAALAGPRRTFRERIWLPLADANSSVTALRLSALKQDTPVVGV